MASSCFVSNSGLDEFVPKRHRRSKPHKRNKVGLGLAMGLGDYGGGYNYGADEGNGDDTWSEDVDWENYGFDVPSKRKHTYDFNHVNKPFQKREDEDSEKSRDISLGLESDRTDPSAAEERRNGRPSMERPTKVYGEVTRSWTPVFTLLEHKYIDKKLEPTELGRPKRRGVLVPAGLTYGRPNEKRDGGSSEALHGWPRLSDTTLPFKRKEKKAQRDFMALNRAAVSAGLVSANDQYEFRATHDVRRKTQSEDSQRTRTRRIPPSMVFGISTRPSTPIFDLLEHKYQDKWLQQRRQMELTKRQEENKQKRCPGQVYETRASLLRTYQNPVDQEDLWQMPKFTKEARPSLQTFRSADARQRAYGHFESDKISRKGNLGHGVFESSKN